jgi:drug/metabolite transporter (DMT)-like permease
VLPDRDPGAGAATVSRPATAEGRGRLAGIALVNLATLTWATNMALGRYLRYDVGPVTLAAARFLLAAPVLLLLLRREPAAWPRPGKERWLLLAMALSGVVAFAPTLYLGLRFTTTVNATLINGLAPLITGLLAVPLIQEPMSRRQVVGALVALAGITILISGGSLAFWREASINVGDLIVLLAVGLWAVYSVLSRRATRRRSAVWVTAFSTFLALPFLLPAAAIEMHFIPPRISPRLLLAILYIALAPTVLGFLSWNAGVRRLGASGAMVFYNTLPLYGALLGWLFLGEPIGPVQILGGGLVVAGGWWAARLTRPADSPLPLKPDP